MEEINYYFSKTKHLDKNISYKNLQLFLKIATGLNLKCFLLFGTLLGFYRDGKFIDEDNDTDIGCTFEEFKNVEKDLIDNLKTSHFKIYRESASLLQIVKDNNHIDLYLFRKLLFFPGRFSGKFFISDNHFDQIQNLKLTNSNTNYPIPNYTEKLLVKFYGKSWKKPLKGKTAKENIFLKLLTNFLPIKIIKFIKKLLKLDD